MLSNIWKSINPATGDFMSYDSANALFEKYANPDEWYGGFDNASDVFLNAFEDIAYAIETYDDIDYDNVYISIDIISRGEHDFTTWGCAGSIMDRDVFGSIFNDISAYSATHDGITLCVTVEMGEDLELNGSNVYRYYDYCQGVQTLGF